jgi:hypothetical protein
MRNAGWGAALETRTRCEQPLGGQLEKWTTFTYYSCSRKELPYFYHPDTIRADWLNGACIVSANRRSALHRWLEAWFSFGQFYGRRALLEIHIRK